MKVVVEKTEDARLVLDRAGQFLSSDAVRHNVILTLLSDRAIRGEPGRFWVGAVDGTTVGVVFQSPLDFPATMTPMTDEVVAAMVDFIADAGIALPGVTGEAATAARFAGQWTERCRSSAIPIQGQRIYEVREVHTPVGVGGTLRQANVEDRERVVSWMNGFHADTGEGGSDREQVVDRRLPAGHFWFWDHDGPVSMAALSPDIAGVARVQAVYTPPELRKSGYAGSCVAALSTRVLSREQRCILYTDLGNPTSNSVYRRIGYRAVSEGLRYRFQ